jgi:hypothetical protein
MTERPTLADVAAIITKGEPPPDWLTEELARYARIIAARPKVDDDDLPELLAAIDCLERELSIRGLMEEAFDIEMPDFMHTASSTLWELREYLEEERRPARRGGPTPNGGLSICAGVCVWAWRRLHGEAPKRNVALAEACEAYWVACGGEPTSGDPLERWRRAVHNSA